MVVNYCVRRILNDGVRDYFNYYCGKPPQLDNMSWCDSPTDINITVLDAVAASNLKSQLGHITHNSHNITYDVIGLADMHDLASKLQEMVNI